MKNWKILTVAAGILVVLSSQEVMGREIGFLTYMSAKGQNVPTPIRIPADIYENKRKRKEYKSVYRDQLARETAAYEVQKSLDPPPLEGLKDPLRISVNNMGIAWGEKLRQIRKEIRKRKYPGKKDHELNDKQDRDITVETGFHLLGRMGDGIAYGAKSTWNFAFSWNGLKLAGAVVGLYAAFKLVSYGVPALIQYMTTKKPDLTIGQSEYKVVRWVKEKFLGYKYPTLSQLNFTPETLEKLERYQKGLYNAMLHGEELPNLLLYGPPGTGKTEIAKRIALESGRTFVHIAGSNFSQYSEDQAIAILNDLFKWANKKGNVLIFIDEVEVLLGDRLDPKRPMSEKTQKILTAFLNHTGEKSRKYAIIAATNLPDSLDFAVGRRFDKTVLVGLPDQETRQQILKGYIKTYIEDRLCSQNLVEKAMKVLNPFRVNKRPIQIYEDMLTEASIRDLAASTEGLSGAELKGIIMNASREAILSDEGILTREMIEKEVKESLEKNKKFVSKTQEQEAARLREKQVVVQEGEGVPLETLSPLPQEV